MRFEIYCRICVFCHSFSGTTKLLLRKKKTKKYWINKITTKYPRKKILDPQNTHEKIFWNHEIHTKKNLELRNTHEKRFWTHNIPTRKDFGPTKYPREKILDPQNTHKKRF